MADGYIENAFDRYREGRSSSKRADARTLSSLLRKNRSYRGYDKRYVVSREVLENIVSVNELLPSAKNQQALRFLLVTKDSGADIVLRNIKLGGMLPELGLPIEGTEPDAFIVVCSTVPESKMLHIDVGISLQSMALRAVELGYNGIMIGAFNAKNIQQEFSLETPPVMLLAIGKGAERIETERINVGGNKSYRRENGVHIVPKIHWKELILDNCRHSREISENKSE
ncbi:MAG: nitroreductase family protein [Bacteroidales bacterium]|nr:nitroreductase family protein [Bacteroidales bacterium]